MPVCAIRPNAWGFLSRWWKQLLTLIVLLFGLGVATWQLLESDANQRKHDRNLFRSRATEVADKLRRQIETSVSSLYAMASMIEVDGGSFLAEHFTPIADTVLTKYKGITNFDIAPFAVVRTKVPAKGNEGAIGHAMLSDPNRIEATSKTIREQKALLDGPIRLRETGGIGVIARYPVFTTFSPKFIPDIRSWWPDWSHACCDTSIPLPGWGAESFPGPVRNGTPTYFYGLVEFVSKLENLTKDLDLESLEQTMTFQIRNKKPHPSMKDSPVFFHSSNIEAHTALGDPEIVPISLLPINVDWEFLAVPVDGWPGPSIMNIMVIAGIYGGLMAAGLAYVLIQRLRSLSGSSKLLQKELQKRREETLQNAWSAIEELATPMVLISAELFMELGRLTSFEELRNTGKVIALDTLAQVEKFRETRWIIFFSHQWLGYSAPDRDNLHYSTMCSALSSIIATLPCKGNALTLDRAFVWVDFGSISQVNRSAQALCINSLPLYASVADAFVMVTPETEHIDTKLPCDWETYSRRGWCRAEILCKVCASGVSNMYIAKEASNLETLTIQKFKEMSISVFEANFSCCALGHPNGSLCDKIKLKSPILGMYLVLSEDTQGAEGGEKATSPDSTKAEVFQYLTEQQELFFPHSTKYVSGKEGQEVVQELFGDVVTTTSSGMPTRKSSSGKAESFAHTSVAELNVGIPLACPVQLRNKFGIRMTM